MKNDDEFVSTKSIEHFTTFKSLHLAALITATFPQARSLTDFSDQSCYGDCGGHYCLVRPPESTALDAFSEIVFFA